MGFKANVKGTIGSDNYITSLKAGKNTIIADEPSEIGGDDKGFNPFELIAAGLSSCTLATLRSYANIKGWEIPEMSVEIDLESFPKNEKAVFKKYIDFKGANLTAEQKQRLFQIAERCPVQKLLQSKIEIFSELKSEVYENTSL